MKNTDFKCQNLILRTIYGVIKGDEHYVLIQGYDDLGFYIFDSYFVEDLTVSSFIKSKEYNRYILFSEFFSNAYSDTYGLYIGENPNKLILKLDNSPKNGL